MTPLVVAQIRRRKPGVELHVLDLGCGTGITAAHLERAGCVVTGVDSSAAMLAVARHRVSAGTTLVRTTIDQPPTGPYDVVLCVFDTLNHLPGPDDLRDVLAAAAAVSRPGATLLFDLVTATAMRTWDGAATLPGEPLLTVTGRCDPDGRWVEVTVGGNHPDGTPWSDVQREVSYDLTAVEGILVDTGWGQVRWTSYADLTATIATPEVERRVVGECYRSLP